MNLNPAVQTAKYAEYAEGHELTIGSMFTAPLRRKTAPANVFLPLSPSDGARFRVQGSGFRRNPHPNPPHEPKVVVRCHPTIYAKEGSGVECANFSGNSLPIGWGEGERPTP